MKSLVLVSQPVVSPAKGNGHCRQTIVVDAAAVHIPAWVEDHAAFRSWFHSDDFPERTGRICYLKGEVWVDMSREQAFTHNQVKAEFNRVLANLVKSARNARFFPDGMLVTNVGASLSSQPDGIFALHESFTKDRIRLVEGKKGGYVELEGTPDMVLEVVSDSSVEKDTVTLRELYWRADIREYWLVDARAEELSFEILRRGSKGYVSTRKQEGWLKSAVFGKSFRLTQQTDERGDPEYTLEAR